MPRAPHHALGLVQNTQWETVGHVVAAVAAQAQATDDHFTQIALHCTLRATDFLLIIIGSFVCVIFLSWFFSLPFLSFFPVLHFFCFIYSAALCSDPLFFLCPLPQVCCFSRPLVPLPLPLSLIFCVCIHLSLTLAHAECTLQYHTSVLC